MAARQVSYAPVGSTPPGDDRWTPPHGFRPYERTVVVGRGQEHWARLAALLLEWGVKTRSGFRIEPDGATGKRVEQGADYWLVASFGPVSVREPARVVAVVEEPDRCGFAYGTLEGHPVSGEEAFVVSRTPEGQVLLTLRSITRSSPGRWRLLFPLILVAQRWYRSRYLRALLPDG
ncbi:DUF1990 domain-containing protein [Blastococcus sp. CT_GayMR16]|nr:DUF1990 domain-containing protein [Blastococcus sp. CT_GayMR16]